VPFPDILVYIATPLETAEEGTLVEGERDSSATEGVPFACCLFLPSGSETSPPAGSRVREVREPTLLYEPTRPDGSAVGLRKESRLRIGAGNLNEAEGRAEDASVEWQVVGSPQPFGPPYGEMVGLQATLRRIED
jgi:hypothetical protein